MRTPYIWGLCYMCEETIDDSFYIRMFMKKWMYFHKDCFHLELKEEFRIKYGDSNWKCMVCLDKMISDPAIWTEISIVPHKGYWYCVCPQCFDREIYDARTL